MGVATSVTRVAIITGASSGIGQAAAVALAKRGYAIVLAARRADRLEQVARDCQQAGSPGVLVAPTDVAIESQVQALVSQAMHRFGRVDVMINNAGYGLFARVDMTPTDEMKRILDVNFMGVFYGCKAVAPIMKAQRCGHIFNMSSVIGKRGTPYHGAYCATKFAIVGLSDSLRVEMMPHNVRVTTVCPALTDTEFFTASARAQKAGESFSKFKSLTPAHVVANKMAAVVGRNKPEIVFTIGGKFLALLSACWPGLADQIMRIYMRGLARSLGEE